MMGSRDVRLQTTSTTAMLSVQKRMLLPSPLGPHSVAAMTIGTNSLEAMWMESQLAHHSN